MTCLQCNDNPIWIKKHGLCQTCYMRRYMQERRGSFKGRFIRSPKLCGAPVKSKVLKMLGHVCDLCEEDRIQQLHIVSSMHFGLQERSLWKLALKDSKRQEHFQLICNRCIRQIKESQ